MKTKITSDDKWEMLFTEIPNIFKYHFTIVSDQKNGKTFALAKRNSMYSERFNLAHGNITNFMSFNECLAFLKGMQETIRLQSIDKYNNNSK